METYAHFVSRKTNQGIKIFRHHTEFHSNNGTGEVVGLVVMMNPGDARPMDNNLFTVLQNSEYETIQPVITKPDKTMIKVMRMIQEAYNNNTVSLPDKYTIHIENIFNIREKNNIKAKKYAEELKEVSDLMFKSRELIDKYQFVFLAWGNLKIGLDRQKDYIDKYSSAIIVNKLNYKGNVINVDYPVHPLYMNTEYFLEASEGRIN
jgi:hypothetical protein